MLSDLAHHVLFDLGALPYAFLTSQPTWRKHGGELARLCSVVAGDRVLDLGCGPGESAFGVAERAPGVEVTGVDLSHAMIAIARFRAGSRPSMRFTQGDAAALPFPNASFEAVVGHSFLYLLPDAAGVLREVRRVLVPGGRCAFLEPAGVGGALPRRMWARTLREPRFVTSMALWRIVSGRYGRFDEARFRSLFAGAGLEMQEITPTLEGLGLFGVARRSSSKGQPS